MPNDPFDPDDLTPEECHAIALAGAELDMLSDLVRLRHRKGLTQEDVANAIGRDKSAVSRFERLDSDPRLSTVRRYARAVGAMVEHRVSEYQAGEEKGARLVDTPAAATGQWTITSMKRGLWGARDRLGPLTGDFMIAFGELPAWEVSPTDDAGESFPVPVGLARQDQL
ncbi:helix-turn-helix domain-containing protein [Mycobacterium riyadhense]|nr:helix-turn-helix transcriptional regulator [Mycobacterium riyadhense]